jgi:hypothetical protein
MISKQIMSRKDGKSSASDALKYGAGLKLDRKTGFFLDKSHRTRLGGFGLVENGVYFDQDIKVMAGIVDLAALEMQANCDLNTKVAHKNKLAHFVFSFDQDKPSEAVLRDAEDSTLFALKLDKNHFATFLHNDNGYWHLQFFASRIEQEKPHRGNSLWRDKTIRDLVCREVEIRHWLKRDNGLHKIDSSGHIVEVPIDERRIRRENAKTEICVSDNARQFETHSGEKSFQSWCTEIRIGDRLKHSKSWLEIHQAATAYNCQIKPKGAGFIICPVGEKGGMQLSKLGLKNLQSKFGEFEPHHSEPVQENSKPVHEYRSEPSKPAKLFFEKWKQAKSDHNDKKFVALAAFRNSTSKKRLELREQQKIGLAQIKAMPSGAARQAEILIAKMQFAAEHIELANSICAERLALYKNLAVASPGTTFRDYLVQQAQIGDDSAVALVKRYGADEATRVSRQAEIVRLKNVASLSGLKNNPSIRLQIKHRIERNGTVVFDLGRGRSITDSATAKQIQLNSAAANDPIAIEIALRFAASRFGKTLTLTGSQDFQRLAVETAVRKGLNIAFSDPNLEQYKLQFATTINHKFTQEKANDKNSRNHGRQQIAAARTRMPDMSKRSLDGIQKRSEMLLPRNDGIHVRIRNGRQTDSVELRRAGGGTATSSGSWPTVTSDERANCSSETQLHPDRGLTTGMATEQGLSHHANESSGNSNQFSPKGASETTASAKTLEGYAFPSPWRQCGGNEPWALVSINGEDWVTHKSGKTEWMAHRLADFSSEQQEAIRAANTCGQPIKFKTGSDGKPLPGSIQIEIEAEHDRTRVER